MLHVPASITVILVWLSVSQLAYCHRKPPVKTSSLRQSGAPLVKRNTDDVMKPRDDIACSADSPPLELTDFSGWFTSPNYTDNYPNDANCQWLILSQSEVVNLDFDFIDTEDFYDYVTFYDGDSLLSPKIASFDGFWSPAPGGIRSSGPAMLVVFTSDSGVNYRGFNVSYTSALTDLSDDPCYTLTRPLFLSDYSGKFQSNGFPDSYWSYANCQWLFESQEPDGIVQVTFDHFSTEEGYDVVRVYDGSSASAPLITGFDGQYPGQIPSVRSTGQYLFMRFLSDYTYADVGFNGTYTSLPQP